MIPKLPGETFVQAFNLPNHMVSDHGRIWSKRFDKILRITPTHYGYLRLCTTRGNRQYSVAVHRLVLQSFVGDRPGLHACHIDGVQANNVLSNLKWGTAKENNADRERHGNTPRGERNGKCIISEETARAIWIRLLAGESAASIVKDLKLTKSIVHLLKEGRTWNHVTGLPYKKHQSRLSPEEKK